MIEIPGFEIYIPSFTVSWWTLIFPYLSIGLMISRKVYRKDKDDMDAIAAGALWPLYCTYKLLSWAITSGTK